MSISAVLYFSSFLPIGVGHHDNVDISKVPDPVPRGVVKPVSPSGETSYIAFDLKTTDLSE